MNLWGIIPFFQISPNSHIAFPIVLALISWVLFIYLGFKKHGAGYLKFALVPPAPWFILPILVPIEFFSNFIVRPFSLAVRLFANMFAGHMLLLVFSLGATYLFTVGGLSYVFGGISFLMAIVMTFFELLVIFLQAYVFTVLMGTYLNGSIEAEH
jgi:F-type H+-transporting ATPase subunit a